MPMMSKSRTTIEDRLENPHPGAGLRADLFEASGVTVNETALATGLTVDAIEAFLDGARRVDADLDLRLGRYLGFSEGYFLRLQNAHDLEEARRANAAALSQIRPRAA